MSITEILNNFGNRFSNLIIFSFPGMISRIQRINAFIKLGKFLKDSQNGDYLQELAIVPVTDEQRLLMSVLKKYQLEGRYNE